MKQNNMRKTIYKAIVTALVFVFGFVCAVPSVSAPAMAASSSDVKIAQATATEKGGIRGGKAGDQTGGEVGIGNWSYSSKSGAYNHWKYVFRLKDSDKVPLFVKRLKQSCANDNIGYDQKGSDRGTFYDEAQKVNWKVSKIETRCETTCAGLIDVCLNAVGIAIPRYWDSGLVYKDLKATGEFYIFDSTAYTAKTTFLEPGDILLSPDHHVCAVVSSPNEIGSTPTKDASASPYTEGTDYQLNRNLTVRTGPGTGYPVKSFDELTEAAKLYAYGTDTAKLYKGTVVTCLATYGKWVMIPSGWIKGNSSTEEYLTIYNNTAEQKELYDNAAAKAAAYAASVQSDDNQTATETKTDTVTSEKKITYKKGKVYTLAKALYVRKGPGTSYEIKNRSQLSADAKKNAYNTTKARLKKGTKVTCKKVKGDWMKIPSGWICCKEGNLK